MTKDGRQSLAAEYARLLIMAAEARRRGIDQTSDMQTLLKFSALQVLATGLVRDIGAHSQTVESIDVEHYFHEHQDEYEEVVVSRILVLPQAHEKQTSVSLLQRATAMRERAAKGEDFALLQHEATPGIDTAASQMKMGPIPCQSLPESHRQICAMPTGEVSAPLADGQGYAIYRLESRHLLNLQDVQDQIRAKLERERVQEEIYKVRTPLSLELNPAYFGSLPAPDLAKHHGMHVPPAGNTASGDATPHQH